MDPRIGWGLAGVAAGGVTVMGGMMYRHNQKNNAERIPLFQDQLQTKKNELEGAKRSLESSIPHDSETLTADQAVAVAQQRFGSTPFTASTSDGDTVGLHARFLTPKTSQQEAAAAARYDALGKSTAVAKVGKWYIPMIMDNQLAAQPHSRQVSYLDQEYQYTYSYNYQSGEVDGHYDWVTVTKWRTEHYASEYDRFSPNKAGIVQAARGTGELMTNQGTPEQKNVNNANWNVDLAQKHLDSAYKSKSKAPTAGNLAFGIGGVTVAAGAALAIVGYIKSRGLAGL